MPQDMQQTLTLVLQARDQASQVLSEVGHKMAELGHAAEALQARAAGAGAPVSGPSALQTVLRQNLDVVQQHYAQQERVVKGAMDRQISVERASAESSLALAKETHARDLADIEKRYDDQRAVAARARRDADAAARQRATTARQASQQQRRTDLDTLKDDLVKRRVAIKAEADAELAIWHDVTREEMYLSAYDRAGAVGSAHAALSDPVKAVVAGTAAEAGLGAAQKIELLDYQSIVAAADDAYKNRVRRAEISLERELAITEDAAKKKLALVQADEDKETQIKNTAANARAAKARETMRLAVEGTRTTYAQTLATLEHGEATETEVVKAQSATRREQLISDHQKTLADTKSFYERELSVIRSAQDQETALLRSAGERQMQLYRRQAADQERLLRQQAAEERKSARAADGGGPGIIGHGIRGLGNIVEQSLVWNAAYAAAGKINQAIGAMASGLLSVNVQLEEYQATFTSIYQNKDKGVEAVRWLTDLAVQIPATRAQTIQAGLVIASLGDNIKDVLPPLANVASIMHVDLPRAAQAFADAQEGRFQMMQTTLHITKQELTHFGLDLDNTGHVLNNSFVKAFEKLGNTRFAHAAADQMQTLGGAVSNLADVFTNLQAALGHGIFKALEDNLSRLLVMLGNPALLRFAGVLGGQLGQALRGVINNIEQWVQRMGGVPGLLTHITRVVHDAAQVFGGLWGAISNVASVAGTLFGVVSPLLGLFAGLSGATDNASGRLRVLVQVLTDGFIAYKVILPMVGYVTQAMRDQRVATALAAESEVAARTATMDLSVVLGENGLSGAAGTATRGMEGLAAVSGEAGAAGALGTAGMAAGRFGGALRTLQGVAQLTVVKIAAITAAAATAVAAWEQMNTFVKAGTNVQMVQMIDQALTPKDPARYGHTLWQGPAGGQGGSAYQFFAATAGGLNPQGFIAYLQSNPEAMQTYLATMKKQGGPWATAHAQAAIQQWTQMQGQGAAGLGATPEQQQSAQNYQAYQAALNQFNAALRVRPQDAAAQLQTVVQMYQTYKLGSQTSQAANESAMSAANALQAQLNAELPAKYQLVGTQGDLSQPGDQTGPSNAERHRAAVKALGAYKAHQWADTLRKIGLGTIDQTDVQTVIDQLKVDEAAAGQPVSDTDIMNKVRGATRAYVATLSGKLQVTFTALRDHARGVTTQTASDLINQIQQAEAAVGLADTTGAAQLKLAQWQAPTGTPLAGSPAAENVVALRASLGDAKAHLAALAKATPGATQAIQAMIDQIAGSGGLVEQYERARGVRWATVLKDEETARLNLTRQYLGTVHAAGKTQDAHSQLAIDLKNLGASSKDYQALLSDAARIQKADRAVHHSKAHAEEAYLAAIGQVNAHMSTIAKSKLGDDLVSLGRSAADHKRLLDDVSVLYGDEKRQYPHTQKAHKDYEDNLRLVAKHMKDGTGAAGVGVPTPLYGPYRIVAPQYGATQASFGGAAQQNSMATLISHLQSLVSYWSARARRDEDALRAQQQTAANTMAVAQNTQSLPERLAKAAAGLGLAPEPSNAGAASRARGGFAPMRRN